jgi:metal-dependent amidase/aminoacylase/carboxypeptidase family protein
MDLQSTIDAALPTITQLRRKLHRIPELGYAEFKTAAAIRVELDRLQIKYVEPIATAPTATIAWIGDTSETVRGAARGYRCAADNRSNRRGALQHARRLHARVRA